MMGIQGLYKPKKSWGGCLHLLLVYDVLKLSAVYVVKSPVLGLQMAFENSVFPPFVQSSLINSMHLINVIKQGLYGHQGLITFMLKTMFPTFSEEEKRYSRLLTKSGGHEMIPDILNSIIIKCNARSTVHSAHRCVLTRFFEKKFLAGDSKIGIAGDSYNPKNQVLSENDNFFHWKLS